MNKDYQAVLDRLYSLEGFGIKLGLENIGDLLARLGDPHRACPAVHVGGTNAKGSVARSMAQILTGAGYRAGLYTSPHLQRFTERIWLAGREVPEDRVPELFDKVWRAMEEVLAERPEDERVPMTYFEVVTAMAAEYFKEESADIVVWEVGMGGRLDATNTVSPLVTVITTVALEHQRYLGSTLAEIAREKAGIIKPDVPLITSVSQPAALDVIREVAAERNAPMFRLGDDFSYTRRGKGRMDYDGLDLELKDLRVRLEGDHQLANAAVAIAGLEIIEASFLVSEDEIRKGLIEVEWPGRLERFDSKDHVLLDGAHNAEAARALATALEESKPRGRRLMLVGMGEDKDLEGFFEILGPEASRVFVTRSQRPSAVPPERLAEAARRHAPDVEVTPDVKAGLAAARAELGPEDELVVCGSLFVVGEAREILEKEKK